MGGRFTSKWDFQDWQLIKLLGQGTLARVYAADLRSGAGGREAPYAIKMLRRKWWGAAGAIRLLRREALVGMRVDHPSVVSVLHAQLSAPPYFVVMPHLAGTSLAARLKQAGRLATADALWIARQVAEGLGALKASCGMTHGDVTPGNIILSPQTRATLVDLAFARPLGELANAFDRPTMCSLPYAAPEMFTSTRPVDCASDVYSLGVILYEMLTGRRPHEADDPGRLIEQIRMQRPLCVRRLRPDLPRPVASLVHQMLAKEPLRRPSSYADLIRSLVRLEIDSFANR